MLEGIPWQTICTILAPWGVVLLGFILMMRGYLTPAKLMWPLPVALHS